MGQSKSQVNKVNCKIDLLGSDKEKILDDENLFHSLESIGVKLTEEQIEIADSDGGRIYYQLGEINYDLEKYCEAYTWFYKASIQNNSNAQTSLGLMYEHKDMGLSNDSTIILCYATANSIDGNKHAQCGLAEQSERVQGIPSDYRLAMAWYEEAARQGHVLAQLALGIMYEKVSSIRDPQKAVSWYKVAADNGFERAKESYEKLIRRGYHPQAIAIEKISPRIVIKLFSAVKAKDRVLIKGAGGYNQSLMQYSVAGSNKSPQIFQLNTSPSYADGKLLKKRMVIWLEELDKNTSNSK